MSLKSKLSVAVAAVLVGLLSLFAASAAAKSGAKQGGTLRIDLFTDVDYTDPALSYLSTGWELEYATCLKLLNYPDANGPKGAQLAPEAAAGFPKVSAGGKVYDFTVKAGFTKFAPTGQTVTAANFKAAFDRNADPAMSSPATAFMDDIVGADKTPVSGVRVKGNHLIVTLKQAAPDFLARIAMPFFCAVPTNLPHDQNGVEEPPSAGPYYIAERTPNKSIVLKKNPYYKGSRPHNVSQVVYTVGNSQEATRLRVERGETDYAGGVGPPAAAFSEIAQKYGINKGQFWVKPLLTVYYLAMNNERPIFKDNVKLRRAVNFAIDRKAILTQSGTLAGKRTDQILAPGLRGFKDADLYPLKGPNIPFAKKLAQGATRDGKVVFYTANDSTRVAQAQIVQFNLKQIRLDVEIKQFARAVQIDKEGTRGEPFDMTAEAWIADYADPYDFIDVLLNGKNLQPTHNNNIAYFNDPAFNKKMNAAALLTGENRYSTYGALDIDLMKNAAPWAPWRNSNARIFVSSKVGCFTFNSIYQVDLAALCMK